jgi:protein CpxP
MKKILVTALLTLTLSGIAQEKRNGKGSERTEFTAEQRNELQVKKLTLELDLNAKQQKEVAEIIANHQTKREALRSEMKNKRAENKKTTADDKFVLKSKVLEERIALKSELKKVLTAEQLEKWEKMPKNNPKKENKRLKRKAQIEK